MDISLSDEPADLERAAMPSNLRPPATFPGSLLNMTNQIGQWFGGVVGNWAGFANGLPSWPNSAQGATETTTMSLPAAWKCAGFLSNAVASCAPPLEFDAAGNRVDRSPVVVRPWSLLSAHEFWVQVVLALLLHGNFIGVKADLDPITDYPRQIIPVPSDQVRMQIDEDSGLPIYGYGDEVYGWDEIVHIRNGYQSAGSLWGVGVVAQFRESLAAAGSLDNFGRTTFASAAENSVVIQVNRPQLEAAEAAAVQDLWIQRHASGIRRPAVIPASMSITPLSFSPADAQFLESRQFTVAEIAFMFLMDPTDLTALIGGQSSQLTYANREQRELERLTHPVGHLMRRIEQAWGDLLPGRCSMAFNVERLLRTDTLTRMQAEDIGLKNGTFTLNDVRNIERLPLYDSWADEPFAVNPNTPMAAPMDPNAITDPTTDPNPADTPPSAEAV